MIYDFIILRTGLPIYSINFDPEHGLSHDEKKFTLISGFFSAISSFVDSVEHLGYVDEIQMSSDTFFCFKKQAIKEGDILFILCCNYETPKLLRKRIIEKTSLSFMQTYQNVVNGEWDGSVNQFRLFDDKIFDLIENAYQEVEEERKTLRLTPDEIAEFYALLEEQQTQIIRANQVDEMAFQSANSLNTRSVEDRISSRFQRYQTLRNIQNHYQSLASPYSKVINPSLPQLPWERADAWDSHGLYEQENGTQISPSSQSDQSRSHIEAQLRSYHENRGDSQYDGNFGTFRGSSLFHNQVFEMVPKKSPITVGMFREHLRDEVSKIMFVTIDGHKTIRNIADQLAIEPNAVLDICQSLASKGMIDFSR